MLLAEVSDVVWQAVIGGVVAVVLAWMQQRTQNAVETAARNAAIKVEGVRTTLEVVSEDQSRKLDGVASEVKGTKAAVEVVGEQVHEVHLATNSMKDELVKVTEAEALARGKAEGIQSEKARDR